MKDSMPALPPGWVWAPLGELADFINGRAFKPTDWKDQGRLIIRIQNLTGSTNERHYFDGNVEARHIVRSGDVLVSWSATLDAYVWNGPESVLNQHIFKVNPFIDKMFLYFLIKASILKLKGQVHGTGMQHITKGRFDSTLVPLPPLAEQHRISAKIQELLSEVRTAETSLRKVPVLAARFRQSVLSKAFSGQLSEREPDRESTIERLEEVRLQRRKDSRLDLGKTAESSGNYGHEAPEEMSPASGLEKLPRGWVWTSLGRLLQVVQYGTSVKATDSAEDGVPVLRMGNIKEGRLDFSDLKYISPKRENVPKYELRPGDILINRTNSPELVGKCALFEAKGSYLFASYLIRLGANPGMADPRYLTFFINSKIARRHIDAVKHQVAGQSNINTRDIRSMPVPLAPLSEQSRIAEKIAKLFAQADQSDAAVRGGLRNVDILERAILAKALRGELVQQDPDDEPVSDLLERIRGQHALPGKKSRSQSSLKMG